MKTAGFPYERWTIVVWLVLHSVKFVSHIQFCSFTKMLHNSYGSESVEPENGEHAVCKLGKCYQLTIVFLFFKKEQQPPLKFGLNFVWIIKYYFQHTIKKHTPKTCRLLFLPTKRTVSFLNWSMMVCFVWVFFPVKIKDFSLGFLECIFLVCAEQILANLFVYQIHSDPLVWSTCWGWMGRINLTGRLFGP